ncbi:MAG TPA: PqqD family protein [Bacteroidota bacterium]
MTQQRYKLNTPAVVEETFDTETVIVNLVSGFYYSATKSGVMMWNLLVNGYTATEIASQLHKHFTGTEKQFTTAVEEFRTKLLAEQLIVAVNGDHTAPLMPPSTIQTPAPFENPVLEKYTDMQDLLLLDPIHEVDDSGWPNKKPEQNNEPKKP